MVHNYIKPTTRIHSTFADAKKYLEEAGGQFWFERDEQPSVDVLAAGQRTLIVGEPGVGKSLLLETVQLHLESTGVAAQLINLRAAGALGRMQAFVRKETVQDQALLLDALDEVKASEIPAVIESIAQLAQQHPEVAVFLSSRWVFIGRYVNQFPGYRIVTIAPFTRAQVREYLLGAGHSESEVDKLLTRILSFGHRMLVVQIPRYLRYLDEYVKTKGAEAASRVSRNELFEYFIYSKLELEKSKVIKHQRPLIKRVLEKLALTMEIFQTNVISTDELMTFFDDVESDLKRVAFSQIDLDTFYDCSLLKVSNDDPDRIEFDNAEFQEYLAAKEITRLPEPSRSAFAFAADAHVNEIYPTWYNALTFLVDMEPALLEQLIEFSGLRADRFRVLDENFLNFLGRIDPRRVPRALQADLFRDVVLYHERALQWLPAQLAETLSGFFEASLEAFLKDRLAFAETQKETARHVRLANVAYVVGYLFNAGAQLDRRYWRAKLLGCVTDKLANEVQQRHALTALQFLRDPSVLEELPDLSQAEELLVREFIDTCKELGPDNPKSVSHFLAVTRMGEIHGRYGLYAMKSRTSVKRFLEAFINDEVFRHEFIDRASVFEKQDAQLVHRVAAVLDDELRDLGKSVLVAAMHYNVAHQSETSYFINGLWSLLRNVDPGFVTEMVARIATDAHRRSAFFYTTRYFSNVLEPEDVAPYIAAMTAIDEKQIAHRVMVTIKLSGRSGAEETYEAGRVLLKDEYERWEREQANPPAPIGSRAEVTLRKFRELLEPEPGQYNHDVFRYYVRHADELEPVLTHDDRRRIDDLLRGTVFKFMDPGKHGVTITSLDGGAKNYTLNTSINIFADALLVARRIRFDLKPYRQQILNLIPFAYSEHLKAIFDSVKDVTPEEMAPIIEVYEARHSDLWRHNPSSFVDAVEQYHVVGATAVLRTLVLEQRWEKSARRAALRVAESISPDKAFLQRVFDRCASAGVADDRDLANVANGLLITIYADLAAIRWRLKQVVQRATAFLRPSGRGAHTVSPLEEEISFGKEFARPLMELKHPGYEADYLAVLDDALALWSRGVGFHEYAVYLWDIVYAYIDNLKEQRSYAPLEAIEGKLAVSRDREGANWLGWRVSRLRSSYVVYLGKPSTIAKAIAQYNHARKFNDKEIRHSADLFRHVQDALEIDLRRWIEGEGAYDVLQHQIFGDGRQQYEKLVQKTLKAQIENVLLKRGFQVEVLREPQLLDEKRTDLLIRYGFAGPVVLEVKLTSNSDIRSRNLAQSASYKSMERYMGGYGASHGIFMVIDNTNSRNLSQIAEAFRQIRGVAVLNFACYAETTRPPRAARRNRRAANKPSRIRKKS